VSRNGLKRDVQFVAPRRDVASVIRRGDVMIVTSETESFGLVALEAMACGIPVVATRCGGIEELVREGETGFLRPVGDLKGLSDGAFALFKDRDSAKAMGRAGRALAQERFGTELVVGMYERLYSEVL
jgi:glycosyltransferase involved in cell wall biosynthesis